MATAEKKQDRTRAMEIGGAQNPLAGIKQDPSKHYLIHCVDKGLEDIQKSVEEMVADGYTIEVERIEGRRWVLSIPKERFEEHERAAWELDSEQNNRAVDERGVFTTERYTGTKMPLSSVIHQNEEFGKALAEGMNG